MGFYILRRIGVSVLLVLGLLTLVFCIMHLVPGDPVERYVTQDVDPEMADRLRRQFGLDAPLHIQYWNWMRAFLVRRDFGISLATQRPVADLLKEAIPNTIVLAGLALLLRFGLGVAVGTISAVRRNRLPDRLLTLGTLVVYSMPSFWLGLMLVLVFSLQLGWLPAGSIRSLDHTELSFAGRIWDRVQHLLLPVFVLGVGGMASTARYMRASLLEVLSQDYVRTARAKGLRERVVVLRHAMRNALLPIVTLLGLSLPGVVGGALIIESIFSWPGMGRLTVLAIFSRDYPVILATSFLSAVLVVAGNLIADIVCSWLDPRTRSI